MVIAATKRGDILQHLLVKLAVLAQANRKDNITIRGRQRGLLLGINDVLGILAGTGAVGLIGLTISQQDYYFVGFGVGIAVKQAVRGSGNRSADIGGAAA